MPDVNGTQEVPGVMVPWDDIVMLAMVLAIVAAVLVAILILVYVWALQHRRELERREAEEPPKEYPPDRRFEI